jgi:hypothetical protein
MELWWTGADGSIQDNYWYDGAQWQRFTLAPAGSAPASGGIEAVSRIPTSMELWWTGADGSIQDNYWYDGAQWQRFTLAPAGSASKTGRIGVTARIPGSMELWWPGAGGSLQDNYWYDTVPTSIDFAFDPIVFGGGVPVGGSAHLTIRKDGSYTFTGHLHDSGATEYSVALAWAVKDFRDMVYTFQHAGHVAGTFETGSRDDDWNIEAHNDALSANWSYLTARSTGNGQASATLDLVNVTNSLIGTLGTVLGVVAIAVA